MQNKTKKYKIQSTVYTKSAIQDNKIINPVQPHQNILLDSGNEV